VALLLALFAMTLLTFIALEVSYDTSVDYVVSTQQVNRVKAYYAAKAGLELSLLRVKLYKQAVSSLGDTLGGNTSMLDPIWSFPFMWPPTLMEAKLSEADKGFLKTAVAESLMQAQYTTSISPEGGQIDINDLGSPVKGLQKIMYAQILKIFQSEIERNEDFRKKYGGYKFEELINNIADYIDEDSESRNGGDESAPYADVARDTLKLPPNRSLRTLDELHQVSLMTDDFYAVLAPKLTIFGTKGININFASRDVLMALDPTMKEEAVDKVIARRGNPKLGGPFKSEDDFFGFISGYGVNTRDMKEAKIPLRFDMELNFRIVSTGIASNVKREITAITYDVPNLASRLAEMLNKDQDQSTGSKDKGTLPGDTSGGAPAGSPDGKKKIQPSKGRPIVVYWEEN